MRPRLLPLLFPLLALGVVLGCTAQGVSPTAPAEASAVPPAPTIPLLRESTATPVPRPAPTQTPFVVLETVEVAVLETVVVTATPAPTVPPPPPSPTPEPLPTPTPWVIVETVEVPVTVEPLPTPTPAECPACNPATIVETVVVTATPTPTATALPTATATATVTPTPTATPIPPAEQVFTGAGLGVTDPLSLNTDRFAIFEIEASGPSRSLSVSVLSQDGCVEPLVATNAPYTGRVARQVKPWETSACTPGVLAAYGSLLVVRTGTDVAWTVTIRQHSNEAAVVPPWAYEGAGPDVAVPVRLAVLDGIRFTAIDNGSVVLEMMALHREASNSYVAMAFQALTGQVRATSHTRNAGVYLPIVHAEPGQRWHLTFTSLE